MTSQFVAIGEAARTTGVKVPTIRYYEDIGLLSRPARTTGNRRSFDFSDLKRLKFIRHARELGFAIDDIRDLIALTEDPDQACAKADQMAQRHLFKVRRRIASLRALEQELEHMVRHCAGGRVAECRVIEILADHGKCLSGDHAGPR
jgi:DNA-binding transcriptional MerR regulator